MVRINGRYVAIVYCGVGTHASACTHTVSKESEMKSLKLKFISYAIPVIVIISLSFLIFFVFQSNNLLEQKLIEFGFSSVETLSYSCELGVVSEDKTFLQAPLEGIFKERDVIFVGVYNHKGHIINSKTKEEMSEEIPVEVMAEISREKCALMRIDYTKQGTKVYTFFSPIFVSGILIPVTEEEQKKIVGFTKVGISFERVSEQIITTFYFGLLMTAFMIFLGAGGVIFVVGKITDPIKTLTKGAEAIGKGDLEHRIDIRTGDEIEELAKVFNKMTGSLEHSMESLEKERASLDVKVKDRTKELQDAQEQLIQSAKMATVGTLAGGVAHEINNPLSTILINSQVLLKETEDEDRVESLRLIEGSARKCRDIVRSLLSYSRKPKLDEFESIDLNKVIKDTLDLIQHQLVSENIAIKTEYGDIPKIRGNANELQQVFTNLILNARDAIKKTGNPGGITTRTFMDGRFIVSEVIDNGDGISKEDERRIFDPFFTTKDVGKGTGLGLSIAYNLIKKHDGKIDISSVLGKGTTFTIKLHGDLK